jgi:hypothetical protein
MWRDHSAFSEGTERIFLLAMPASSVYKVVVEIEKAFIFYSLSKKGLEMPR